MPKRIPTPPPGDDEPKYLTVVHPYAIHGTCNMELPKDREDFARWVACCIDRNAFFAIFHKPSSRGMVIIEVNKNYAHFDRILGEHRWSEFLRKPNPEEKERVTQVFYCTYNTGRIVQKNGWKRIDVDEAWFKGWSERNKNIQHPYPPTHFCDVPIEDMTNLSMCRPLPGAVKETPVEVVAAPQPVVGSAEWIQTKGGRPTPASARAVATSKPKSAWEKGAPKMVAAPARSNPTANGSVKKTASAPQTSNTSARVPAIGGGPVAVKAVNVWKTAEKKPVPAPAVANWDESAPVSRGGTPVSRAISPLTTQQAPVVPPGSSAAQNAWQRGPSGLVVPASSVTQGVSERTNSSSTSCWDSTGNSASSPDSDSGPDLTTATDSDNPYAVHIHFSESMEEEFHGMGIRAIDDEEDLRELDSVAPGSWDVPAAATWEATNAGGWDNPQLNAGGWDNPQLNAGGWDNEPLDAEDQWRQQAQPAEKPMLCKAHGVVCKKGICAEYARQVRLAKRAEEEEKRKAENTNKGKKGGRFRKKTDENDEEATERRPMVNNAFRGPGAPVKTNWRGAPRAIVSADVIEKRETTKAASNDGWGNSDSEVEPNVAAVEANDPVADAASGASWNISENAARTDPWADAAQPAKTNRAGGKPQQGKKKPVQTKAASSWADEVDAQFAAGDGSSASVVSSKRSKRGGSTASRGTRSAKSSASGWGEVPDMPW